MNNIRNLRANEEVMKALGTIIQTKMNDPRLQKFITLTYVNLSSDFRYAKIGVSVYNANGNDIIKILQKSKGYLKHELMQVVKLPYTPELKFILDTGAIHSDNINSILSTLNIPELEEEENNDEDIDF